MLRDLFENHDGRLIHKWEHYLDIYQHYFSQYQDKKINLLEFGVFQGGSLQLWKNFFGKDVNIFGVDIDLRCENFNEEQIQIIIGNQEDEIFLKEISENLPELDIIIDDGGHTMLGQNLTLKHMWPRLRMGGLFVIEDLHTSYWPEFHGGFGKKETFIETIKNIIDSIHARHSRDLDIHKVNEYTSTVGAIHVYDSVVILEKRKAPELVHRDKGIPSW